MAESTTEITNEELKEEIAEILTKVSLANTSTKKVIQKLEKKFGVDLTEKKKLIDQMVMDFVNNMDSDEGSEEEPPEKVMPKKKPKKEEDEDDDEDIDDSNDSDWGEDHHLHHHHHHEGHLSAESSDESCRHLPQEPTSTTSGVRHLATNNQPRKAFILKRVSQVVHEEDESDIFGKLTAKRLRKLPEEKRDAMMIKINQLFYDNSHKRRSPRRQQKKTTAVSPGPKEATKVCIRFGHLFPSANNATKADEDSDFPTINFCMKPWSFVTSTDDTMSVAPESNGPEPVASESNRAKPVVLPSEEPLVQIKQEPGITFEPVVEPATDKASGNESGKKKTEEKKKKSDDKKKKATPKSKKKDSDKTKKGGGAGGVTKRRKGSGYTKACKLSPALAELMGETELPRHEVVKRVWAIIKEKQLFDPKNRQYAICDKALFKVIGEESFHTFSMMKYLKNHFLD